MRNKRAGGRNKHTGPHEGGPYYFCAPWRTREASKAPSETPWCSRQMRHLDRDVGFGKIRCPDCGRLLQVMTVDIEGGYGDFWPYLPPHKRRNIETVKHKAHQRRTKKKEKSKGIRGK